MENIFKEIAEENYLDLEILGKNKIYKFFKDEKIFTVYNYYFDNNPSGVVEICRDKEATSDVLTASHVPNIVHKTFCFPLSLQTPISNEDIFEGVENFAKNFDYSVVCKPPLEANGQAVYFCESKPDLVYAVTKLISLNHNICICPFFSSQFEYRIFIINGELGFIYKKIRPYIVGNNKDCIKKLFLESNHCSNFSLDKINPEILRNPRIPREQEIVFLTRQHNLSYGATADFDIDDELCSRLHELALAAAKAINISFCSVDILENEEKVLKVLEINPGIRTELLISQHGIVGYQVAKNLYEKAIMEHFKI